MRRGTAVPTRARRRWGERLRAIFGGSIGNLIEWYDFYVYNSFALYFAKLFTASNDPTVQFITVFGIYAVGFFIRPVGGWCSATMPTAAAAAPR